MVLTNRFAPKVLKSPIGDFNVILFKHPVFEGVKANGVPNAPLPPLTVFSELQEHEVFAGKQVYSVSNNFQFCRKHLIQFYFNCSIVMNFGFGDKSVKARYKSSEIAEFMLRNSVDGSIDVSRLFHPFKASES